jgi:hypothetical protein
MKFWLKGRRNEVNQCQMSKLALSDEPKGNQVQMKSQAQSGKRMPFDFVVKKNIFHSVI